MSRLKKFTRSLLAGYLMLGANIFYTLASVPLALHYLGKPEFGLWVLVSSLGGYIALIDLGMAGSVSRILIDHKDDRQTGAYGGVIKTGALVGLVQGALIVLAGTALSALAGALLRVPLELRHEFVWLMTGQALLLGLSFATRAQRRAAIFEKIKIFIIGSGFTAS
jgi:O-antigen/teichoic acid export membrane protein